MRERWVLSSLNVHKNVNTIFQFELFNLAALEERVRVEAGANDVFADYSVVKATYALGKDYSFIVKLWCEAVMLYFNNITKAPDIIVSQSQRYKSSCMHAWTNVCPRKCTSCFLMLLG